MTTLAPTLTDRQRELLALLAADHTLQSAADVMCISRHTAKQHLRSIFLTLCVHKTASAVGRAISLGIIPPSCENSP